MTFSKKPQISAPTLKEKQDASFAWHIAALVLPNPPGDSVQRFILFRSSLMANQGDRVSHVYAESPGLSSPKPAHGIFLWSHHRTSDVSKVGFCGGSSRVNRISGNTRALRLILQPAGGTRGVRITLTRVARETEAAPSSSRPARGSSSLWGRFTRASKVPRKSGKSTKDVQRPREGPWGFR